MTYHEKLIRLHNLRVALHMTEVDGYPMPEDQYQEYVKLSEELGYMAWPKPIARKIQNLVTKPSSF